MQISTLANFIFLTKEADKKFQNLSVLTEKLGSGKNIDLFYSSPSGVYESESLKGLISKDNLYKDNAKFAKTYLLTADDILGKVYQTVLEIKTKLIQFANGIKNENGTTQIAVDEGVAKEALESLKNTLLQYANTKIGDYYIFSGNNPTQAPFDSNYNYQGGPDFHVKIGDNNKLLMYVDGSLVFGSGNNSIFAKIDNLINNISDIDTLEQGIGDMENFLKQIDEQRAKVGLAEQKLEQFDMTYSNLINTFKNRVSEIEDTDIVQTTTDYQRIQTAYQAILSIIGKQQTEGSYLLKYF